MREGHLCKPLSHHSSKCTCPVQSSMCENQHVGIKIKKLRLIQMHCNFQHKLQHQNSLRHSKD